VWGLWNWITDNRYTSQYYPCNRQWRPIQLWDVEDPTFSRQSAHRWRWGCQPYPPAAFYLPRIFLELTPVRGWVIPRAIVRLGGLGKLKKKKSNNFIRYLTRDFPACSTAPQLTRDLPACSTAPQPSTLLPMRSTKNRSAIDAFDMPGLSVASRPMYAFVRYAVKFGASLHTTNWTACK
jgi:hypothetical protein